jgi:NADH-quinone oxidoreductase subunit N
VLAASALSLIGVPPLMGFFGKFFIFLAGVEGRVLPFVILMVTVSVISAFYYLRLVKAAFFDAPRGRTEDENVPVPLAAEIILLFSAVLTLGGGLASGLLMAWMLNPRY